MCCGRDEKVEKCALITPKPSLLRQRLRIKGAPHRTSSAPDQRASVKKNAWR
jgi:hypothetical protein